jgi:hypothetical protein
MKTFFLSLITIFFTSYLGFAQGFSGKITESGYTFFYQAIPLSGGKYDFTVKNILKANTDEASFVLAYQSHLQVIKDGNQLKETRIYASSRNGASWTVANTECLRLLYNYQTSAITSQTVGTSLTNIESAAAPKLSFSKTTLQDKQIIQTIAEQFIKRYYKIFDLGNSPKTEIANLSGEIRAENGENYSFELISQGSGQDELSIRHKTQGLVYRTTLLANNQNNFSVKILYATRQDISWNIYSSDYWEIIFNQTNKTATASKSSLFLPAIPENKQKITFGDTNKNAMTKTAIELFIQTYYKLF